MVYGILKILVLTIFQSGEERTVLI